MEIDKNLFIKGLLITMLLFLIVLFLNTMANDKREDVLVEKMNRVVQEYEDMQALMFMSEFFGEEATCVALGSMLSEMNKGVWDLGIKIDLYRQAREEFMEDPFYIQQKKEFNRKEVLYFSMLKKMKEMCRLNQTMVSFFYRKKEFCLDCDAQSFVLSDIKRDLGKLGKDEELPVFSFDADMGIPAINLLIKFYDITEYPCLVIEDQKHCGLHNKKETLNLICKHKKLPLCK
jgi:hypothetical protein